jgi:hypothetical protein
MVERRARRLPKRRNSHACKNHRDETTSRETTTRLAPTGYRSTTFDTERRPLRALEEVDGELLAPDVLANPRTSACSKERRCGGANGPARRDPWLRIPIWRRIASRVCEAPLRSERPAGYCVRTWPSSIRRWTLASSPCRSHACARSNRERISQFAGSEARYRECRVDLDGGAETEVPTRAPPCERQFRASCSSIRSATSSRTEGMDSFPATWPT